MPSLGRKTLTITNDQDDRLNVIISGILAFQIIKESYYILKRWDFAISSYNNGIRPFLQEIRKRKSTSLETLENFYANTQNNSIGFAAKSFYYEFLALAHHLAYNFDFFNQEKNNKNIKEDNLLIYLSLCGMIPQKFFQSYKPFSKKLRSLNNHLKKPNKFYKRGTIIISDTPLNKNLYYRPKIKTLLKSYPKKWKRLIKNRSCPIF